MTQFTVNTNISSLKAQLVFNKNKVYNRGGTSMSKTKGAQTVELIRGRKIVLSAGVGKTNVDELNQMR